VEFALILPFLVLMIILILDFGRAFNIWINTTHLASEGARLAAVDNAGPGGDLQAYIRGKAGTKELREGDSRWVSDPVQVCVGQDAGDGDDVGDPVTVEVTATYHFLPIENLGIDLDPLADMNIHGKATMRREVAPSNVSSGCG
jgi:hypothetical protein